MLLKRSKTKLYMAKYLPWHTNANMEDDCNGKETGG